MESTPDENAALVRAFLSHVACGDIDALGVFRTDNADDHQSAFDGRSGVKRGPCTYWCVLAAAGAGITIDEEVAANNTGAVRGTATGIQRESLSDWVPTGRSFEIACAWVCRIENGRIMEIGSLPDGRCRMRQLDAIPEASLNRSPSYLT